jgi:Spore coat protein
MANIIGNMIKNNVDLNDATIATNMLASAKSAADVYLNATLTSTTPELRSIYSANLNQIVGGHTGVTELCVNRQWEKPYDTPSKQLTDIYNEAKSVVEPER